MLFKPNIPASIINTVLEGRARDQPGDDTETGVELGAIELSIKGSLDSPSIQALIDGLIRYNWSTWKTNPVAVGSVSQIVLCETTP